MNIIYPHSFLGLMMRIAKNRILDMFLKFVLVTALVHIGVLIVYSIATWNLAVWNYFNILDVSLFIPGISVGQISWMVSGAIIATLFIAIFLFFTKSEKKKKAHAKRPMIVAKVKHIASSAAKSVRTPELD